MSSWRGRKRSFGAPTEILNGDAQIGFKPHGIHDVPAIQAKASIGAVEAIRFDHLGHSQDKALKIYRIRRAGVRSSTRRQSNLRCLSRSRWGIPCRRP